MCQQYLTLYDWCQCEVDSGHKTCGAGKPNAECEGTSFETVRMQCFCNNHATKKFLTEKKHQRKLSRSSTSSTSSGSSRNSRYSDISLPQEKDPQLGPIMRKRWYRMWGKGF
ncbi:hypothetical protein BJY04DRAFT_222245 [Aspergillus karnatakaensis]|uniref:uncharacterized protein n=1 Tax=Aspergillus karnatakaensis TaxID=1810916 RepID=UPI003CCD7ED0